jgi:hypothetical protein
MDVVNIGATKEIPVLIDLVLSSTGYRDGFSQFGPDLSFQNALIVRELLVI